MKEELKPENISAVSAEADAIRAEVDARIPEHDAKLVAEIASRLLTHSGSAGDAVKNGLGLLDATIEQLAKRRELRDKVLAAGIASAGIRDSLKFIPGIKFITGQQRGDRAQADFQDHLRDSIFDSKVDEVYLAGLPPNEFQARIDAIPRTTPEEINRVISRYEKSGFSREQLARHLRLFQRWRQDKKKKWLAR